MKISRQKIHLVMVSSLEKYSTTGDERMNLKLNLTFAIILCVILTGCLTPEYQTLTPTKTVDYSPDIIGKCQGDMWYWVRGRINGDIDGKKDGNGEKFNEEVLLVTQQSGKRSEKATMNEAYIIICKRNQKSGYREIVARKTIYSISENINLGTMPKAVVGSWIDKKFENGSIQLSDIDGDQAKEIIASLWYKKNNVYYSFHCCLKLINGKLYPMMAVKTIQNKAKITAIDINKDGIEELVVPTTIDNTLQTGKNPTNNNPMPEWISIYSLANFKTMKQSNSIFPEFYTDTMLKLYEDMAVRNNKLNDKVKGVHQLYLGLIYGYRNQQRLSDMFLKRAATNHNEIGKLTEKYLGNASITHPNKDVNNFKDGPEL